MTIKEIESELFLIENSSMINVDKIIKKLKLEEEEDIEIIKKRYEQAIKIAVPKFYFRISYLEDSDVNVENGKVKIGNSEFISDTLAKNLAGTHRVFSYVATCGEEIETWSHLEKDYVIGFWIDTIKEMFLYDVLKTGKEYIKKTYGIEKLSSINPGSGDLQNWPIAQQTELFELIGNVTDTIGVTLTDSYLMLPTKSSSGILFISDKSFVNCTFCSRENCNNRHTIDSSESF